MLRQWVKIHSYGHSYTHTDCVPEVSHATE